MQLHWSSTLVLWWVVVVSTCWNVQGQLTHCDHAKAFSSTVLRETKGGTAICATDLSTCGTVSCNECELVSTYVSLPYTATVACSDSCPYTVGDLTVTRTAETVYGLMTLIESNYIYKEPIIFVSTTSTFSTESPVQGTLTYLFDAAPTDDNRVIRANGTTCSFSFNGVDCTCDQVYCDESQTTYADRIDCTGVEGGAVIDMCRGVSLTDTSSLLEILYAIPYYVCDIGPTATDGDTAIATTVPVSGTSMMDGFTVPALTDTATPSPSGPAAATTSPSANAMSGTTAGNSNPTEPDANSGATTADNTPDSGSNTVSSASRIRTYMGILVLVMVWCKS